MKVEIFALGLGTRLKIVRMEEHKKSDEFRSAAQPDAGPINSILQVKHIAIPDRFSYVVGFQQYLRVQMRSFFK